MCQSYALLVNKKYFFNNDEVILIVVSNHNGNQCLWMSSTVRFLTLYLTTKQKENNPKTEDNCNILFSVVYFHCSSINVSKHRIENLIDK